MPLTLDDARRSLRTHFGYDDFRVGQAQAVESILAGRDTLTVLPTGGGKSLCYQIPALLLDGLTVVVSPLISLMKDQVDALVARGLPAAFINSTLSAGQAAERFQRAKRGEIKLLYVAPERFDAGNTAERLAEMGVSLLAIDEAHCISEWGHDFRPSYLRMGQVRERLGAPPTIALTATATPEVRRDIAKQLHLDSPTTVIAGFDRTNLTYHVLPTPNEAAKDRALVRALREEEGLAIVYAATRKSVERISSILQREGIASMAYHAGLDDAHRHEVQDAFMREEVKAIVATNAFGMGIDKANVRLVVHHAMPGTLEAYYQEAGRAGRDGLPSRCLLLHSFPDRFTHEFFIKGAYPERDVVARAYAEAKRAADPTGRITSSPRDMAGMMSAKTSEREVESALRVLAQAGAIAMEPESGSRVWVRLLATPERIKEELTGEGNRELGFLRALWKAAGKRLAAGAVVDLETLPPGFGGTIGAIPLLSSLESRQFLTWDRTEGGPRLVSPGTPVEKWPIDWATIERRRRADLSKLDAMQRYCYTNSCRRAFVLRYFGDPAARDRCEGCDNCLGLHKGIEREAPAAPKERRRRQRGGDEEGGGVLVQERASEVEIGPDDAPLLADLRSLRSRIAKEDRVPAYVVFPDRTLAELAVRRPRSLAAMSGVRGIGAAKLEKYGERFLEVIRAAG